MSIMCTPPQERVILGPIYDRALQRGDAPMSPEGELLVAEAISKLSRKVDGTPKSARKATPAKPSRHEIELPGEIADATELDTENFPPSEATDVSEVDIDNTPPSEASPAVVPVERACRPDAEIDEDLLSAVEADDVVIPAGNHSAVAFSIAIGMAVTLAAGVAASAVSATLKTSGVAHSSEELGAFIVSWAIQPVPRLSDLHEAFIALTSAAAATIGPDVASAVAVNMIQAWNAVASTVRGLDSFVPTEFAHAIVRFVHLVYNHLFAAEPSVAAEVPKIAGKPTERRARSQSAWMETAMMMAS